MRTSEKQEVNTPERRPWERPSLKAIGTVAEILEGGGGKQSLLSSDSGDVHKPNGQS